MSRRVHERVPYAVQVEFRTASSFLVAYSINLSRGGIFLETNHAADIGSPIELQLAVPGVGPLHLVGRVAWRRAAGHDGPPGLGIEFHDPDPIIDTVIDQLVAGYQGLKILVLSRQQQSRDALVRLVRSVMSSATITTAADTREAESLLSSALDLAIIDTDPFPGAVMHVVRKAKSSAPPVPVLALVSNADAANQARLAGVDEIAASPPLAPEFQILLVRALCRPMNVR